MLKCPIEGVIIKSDTRASCAKPSAICGMDLMLRLKRKEPNRLHATNAFLCCPLAISSACVAVSAASTSRLH